MRKQSYNKIIKYKTFAIMYLYDKDNIIKAKTKISVESIEIIKNYRWYLRKDGYIACNNYNGKYIYLHRLLMNVTNKITVDHRDRDKLNNQLNNLRLATQTQQNANQKIRQNNTSGKRGVRYAKDKNKWHAGISYNKKRIHLGYFDSFEEAVKARKDAEKQYFGEYNIKQ